MIEGERGPAGSPIIKTKIIGSRAKIVTDGILDIVLTKSADTLLGTALLRGMEVMLNYSTNEVVVEKKSNWE